jgi:hypothetical protein
LGAEFGLEPLQLARYRGRGAMQAACRASDRPGYGKFNQCMKVFEHGGHPGPRNINGKILRKSQYHSDYNELDERCPCANNDVEPRGAGQDLFQALRMCGP